MPAQSNTQEFINKAFAVHGDKFDYSEVDYKSAKDKVKIRCKKHTFFYQSPNNHLNGKGCRECQREGSGGTQRLTTQQFIDAANIKHNFKFDYSLVDYKNNCTPVKIKCPVHGLFEQKPAHHRLNGCKECGEVQCLTSKRENFSKLFVERAKNLHGDKYDYSESVYLAAKKNIKIFCKSCQTSFMQHPDTHLHGGGCAACAGYGYRTNRPGILYIFTFENLVKFGITNDSVVSRLQKLKTGSGRNFELFTYIRFSDGQVTNDIETVLLRKYRKEFAQLNEVFDGSTECFIDVDSNQLLKEVVQLSCEIIGKYKS